jgi:hypothetical protein
MHPSIYGLSSGTEVQSGFPSGMIPVVSNVVTDDALIDQSMDASRGASFPVELPDEVRKAYWDSLMRRCTAFLQGLIPQCVGKCLQ